MAACPCYCLWSWKKRSQSGLSQSQSTSITSDSAPRLARYAASRASHTICLSVRGHLGRDTQDISWVPFILWWSSMGRGLNNHGNISQSMTPQYIFKVYNKSICKAGCQTHTGNTLERSIHGLKLFQSILKRWPKQREKLPSKCPWNIYCDTPY